LLAKISEVDILKEDTPVIYLVSILRLIGFYNKMEALKQHKCSSENYLFWRTERQAVVAWYIHQAVTGIVSYSY